MAVIFTYRGIDYGYTVIDGIVVNYRINWDDGFFDEEEGSSSDESLLEEKDFFMRHDDLM